MAAARGRETENGERGFFAPQGYGLAFLGLVPLPTAAASRGALQGPRTPGSGRQTPSGRTLPDENEGPGERPCLRRCSGSYPFQNLPSIPLKWFA
jgi:hypothetical protein